MRRTVFVLSFTIIILSAAAVFGVIWFWPSSPATTTVTKVTPATGQALVTRRNWGGVPSDIQAWTDSNEKKRERETEAIAQRLTRQMGKSRRQWPPATMQDQYEYMKHSSV